MQKLLALAVLFFPLAATAGDLHVTGEEDPMIVTIPKPSVAYVLSPPELTPKYDFELKESFLPRIQETVNTLPR